MEMCGGAVENEGMCLCMCRSAGVVVVWKGTGQESWIRDQHKHHRSTYCHRTSPCRWSINSSAMSSALPRSFILSAGANHHSTPKSLSNLAATDRVTLKLAPSAIDNEEKMTSSGWYLPKVDDEGCLRAYPVCHEGGMMIAKFSSLST